LPDIPKHNACEAFSAFSQSLRAAPVKPAHELAAAAGGGVAGAALVVADVEVSVLAGACASNGVTNISDIAHATALIVHGFIKPPFAMPNKL
jgi:hypothetical protein